MVNTKSSALERRGEPLLAQEPDNRRGEEHLTIRGFRLPAAGMRKPDVTSRRGEARPTSHIRLENPDQGRRGNTI